MKTLADLLAEPHTPRSRFQRAKEWVEDFTWSDFVKYDIPNFLSPVEWWWQRRTRGWDDRDLWSLDHTIARFVLPRLIELKKVKPGVPMDFFPEGCINPTDEEQAEASRKMHEVLDKMIYSMQAILDDNRPELDSKNPEVWRAAEERIQEGFELFGKFFQMLWT